MLTPHAVYEHFISAANKQMLAIVAGGVAGTFCFIGLTMLIWRRTTDSRIRLTSHRSDLALKIGELVGTRQPPRRNRHLFDAFAGIGRPGFRDNRKLMAGFDEFTRDILDEPLGASERGMAPAHDRELHGRSHPTAR